MAYPTTIDAPGGTAATGTTLLANVDHALDHRTLGSAVIAIENKLGVGSGSASANQILVGSGAGTATWGTTWNNGNLGTPLITGGTANNLAVGTPTIILGSDAQGDLFYRSSAGTMTRLGIGSNGQVLTTNGTTPSWGASASSIANIYQNGIINGGCLIAQRAAPAISTSYQYGQVDRFAAVVSGTVSAGNITQTTVSSAGVSGYGLRISGLTTTGVATTVSIRYRMEAKDAVKFKNQSASFSCKVYQATGGAINYTITINKANAADNFSAVTNVATSSNISVTSALATTIKFENQALGDVSNGLEIIVTAAVGAVTTQNLDFTEFQFNQGATAVTFYPKTYEEELSLCQRYCYAFTSTDTNSTVGIGTCGSTTLAFIYLPFKISMRTNPTITSVTASDWRVADGAAATTAGTISLTSLAGHNDTVLLSITVASGLTQFRPMQMQSTASGKSIIFDAEL